MVERSEQLAQRNEIYEAKHPETKKVATEAISIRAARRGKAKQFRLAKTPPPKPAPNYCQLSLTSSNETATFRLAGDQQDPSTASQVTRCRKSPTDSVGQSLLNGEDQIIVIIVATCGAGRGRA